MIFHCCERRRLEVLRRSSIDKNAIEFLEVLDHAAPPGVEPQRTLFVRLLRSPAGLAAENVRIDGGERIPTVAIEWIATADALPASAEPGLVDGLDELPRTLVVRTASSGDFSRYTLALVESVGSSEPPDKFDPLLSSIEFSFKVECPADFDCAEPLPCASAPVETPRIDYLARDYEGFRRLMLDRLSLLTPSWRERSAADAGVALVELLAYAADNLSYRQDVIANEAYLTTARQRISVRRHARLVDYHLHEGCNARVFVHFMVGESGSTHTLPAGTPLFTRAPDLETVITESEQERAARAAAVLVFETVHAQELRKSLNELHFYTWGDDECCLPRGATSATLQGHAEGLARGDFLAFVETRSPTTPEEADADRTHRHVVRLTRVALEHDPSGKLFDDDPVDEPAPITRIEWDPSDALPFALCISVAAKRGVSVALGNVVLAEHGEKQPPEELLPPVPKGDKRAFYARRARQVGDRCDPPPPLRLPLRYRPTLKTGPLSHGFRLAELLELSGPTPPPFWSAAALRALHPRDAAPQVKLVGKLNGEDDDWEPRRDLLGSDGGRRDFVVEIQDDGRARLRFGDDTHGRRPEEDTAFDATYRVGNGVTGNVGAEAIEHVVLGVGLPIEKIYNPLPAFGGIDAEDIEAARRDAPQAYRTQDRAVTAADYAAVAGRHPGVQRAAASFRWTGSWHTVFVTADRIGGDRVDDTFERDLRQHLEPFRMAGYDLEVDAPRLVPLDVALHVCVKPGYFRSAVLAAVREVLSSVMLADGRLGAFHPDKFTFGEPVYSSRLIAAAQAVEGVESVRLERFQRLAGPDPSTLETGVIPIGRLEVAQLANDPNYRDRGRLQVSAGGGK